MTTIKSFDKPNLRILGDEIQAALDTIAKKHGLKGLRAGNVRFTAAEFTTSVTGTVDAASSPAAAMTYDRYFKSVGFKESMIGRTMVHKGKTYTITGFNPKKVKYCIEVALNDKPAGGFSADYTAYLLGVKLFDSTPSKSPLAVAN